MFAYNVFEKKKGDSVHKGRPKKTSFCLYMTEKGQVVGVLFIDFRKAFDTPKSSEENECLWYVSGDIYSYLKN